MVRRGKEVVQAQDEDGKDIWQFDSMGANKSLELMGKSLKMFTDKVEVEAGSGLAELLNSRRKAVEDRVKCKPSEEQSRAEYKHESNGSGIDG